MEASHYLGLISGERRRDHAEVAGRAARCYWLALVANDRKRGYSLIYKSGQAYS